MLGLGEQVERAAASGSAPAERITVRSLGPGEAVDADVAGHLPLGLLHPQAARPDDHVDRRHRLRAVGERGDRLRAAHPEHGVDLAQRARGEDRRVRRRPRRTTSSTPAARAVTAPMTTVDGYGLRPPGRRSRRAPTGTSRSRTVWPCGSVASASASSPPRRPRRTFATPPRAPRARPGRAPSSAAASSSGVDPQRAAAAEALLVARAARASPPARTAATICAHDVRDRRARRARPGAPRAASARGVGERCSYAVATDPRHHVVDRGGLELVGDRVGDQPRGRGGDLLADHEPVLAQRRAGRGEVDDPVHEPGQRRQLDRALDLDDLGLAAGALEVGAGDPRVLRRDPHHAEPPQRLGGAVLARDGGEHHPARPEAEVEQLVDVALGVLGEHVLAGDPEVGGARLDVDRHVGGAHRDQPGVLEQQLAVVGADLGGVDPEPVEQVERLAQQRAARDRDREPVAHRPSPTRAACSRSTSSAQPQAGSSRPKRPSRSS